MNNTEEKPPLMSAGLQSFLWHRIIEILGLFICAISLCLLLILVTANDNDPSFNTASSQDVQNWFGLWGANLANFLFNAVGLSAVAFAVAPFVWGTRLIFNKKLIKWKWRLLVLFFSVVLLSMAAYGLFDSTDAVQRGGPTGRLCFGSLCLPIWQVRGAVCPSLIGGVSAGIGMAFFWATALSSSH